MTKTSVVDVVVDVVDSRREVVIAAVAVAAAAAAAAAKTVTSAESIFVRVFPFSLESLFDQSLVLDVDGGTIIDAPLATKNDLESDETFEISSDDIPNGFNVVTIFADSA